MTKVFLSAEWRHLAMLNYEVDPAILLPYLPEGVEIDLWKSKALVSLVGFLFLNAKVKGIAFPFHTNFEEFNLRFYVKHKDKRGVVFIKEIVPRKMIAFIANRLFNENYVALPMRHKIDLNPYTLEFGWKLNDKWQNLLIQAESAFKLPEKGSEEEFITEHYFGYSGKGKEKTIEYEVIHPRWRVSQVKNFSAQIDFDALYGPIFSPFLKRDPVSAFVAEGSDVKVLDGRYLTD